LLKESKEIEESLAAEEQEIIPEKKKAKEEIPNIDVKKLTLEELAVTLEKLLNDFSVNTFVLIFLIFGFFMGSI